MNILLRGLLILLGLGSVGISLGHLALGPEVMPGTMPVNATLDGQDRFFAALFLGYGVAVLWAARDWRGRFDVVRALLAVLFLGGLGRLAAMAASGLPHPFFLAMTAIELALLPLVVWLGTRAGAPAARPGRRQGHGSSGD